MNLRKMKFISLISWSAPLLFAYGINRLSHGMSHLFLRNSQSKPKYHKNPKSLDTQKICSNHVKIWITEFGHSVMRLKDADGMVKSVDPDQTPPPWAVWAGSTLFAQTGLCITVWILSSGFIHVREMSGNFLFFQGQGIVREFHDEKWNFAKMSVHYQGILLFQSWMLKKVMAVLIFGIQA